MAVEITWLGRTCFRLRGREGVVVTDPCPPESGWKIGRLEADVVTLSRRDLPAYSYRDAIKNDARVLDAPGEFEVGGILVSGFAMKREDGRNVGFIVELDGIRIGHLGTPAPNATASQFDDFRGVNILLLPVGGGGSLGGALTADVMTAIDPAIAIPMHYAVENETLELDPLDRFLKETGAKPEPQTRFQATRSQLPAELTVVVLQPRT